MLGFRCQLVGMNLVDWSFFSPFIIVTTSGGDGIRTLVLFLIRETKQYRKATRVIQFLIELYVVHEILTYFLILS